MAKKPRVKKNTRRSVKKTMVGLAHGPRGSKVISRGKRAWKKVVTTKKGQSYSADQCLLQVRTYPLKVEEGNEAPCVKTKRRRRGDRPALKGGMNFMIRTSPPLLKTQIQEKYKQLMKKETARVAHLTDIQIYPN